MLENSNRHHSLRDVVIRVFGSCLEISERSVSEDREIPAFFSILTQESTSTCVTANSPTTNPFPVW
ncbi:hypothetical protein DY000_02050115 [Brassica cretica]|uniref:Uncharacterized protein n=1 Tax=Brassica cretica TaxID=69181 RepID=A0ABQ7EY00_BRACR|nr:hypothetical protein DY000_02050115 [Brassica cretica]